MRYDVVALGDNLVDFVVLKGDKPNKIYLEGNPGGASANVMGGAARLGLKTAFISKMSTDGFGRYLHQAISDAGIDTRGIVTTDSHLTTLAIVTLNESGDRSFSFYRKQTADVMLTESEVDYSLVKDTRVFHFGSVSMTVEPVRSATLAAAAFARRQGIVVSYDPNLREMLWENLDIAKTVMLRGMELADLVKVTDEELRFLTGEQDLEQGMQRLTAQYPMRLLAVTLGPKGCIFRCGGRSYRSETFDVKCIDTTGAGDAFWAATLYQFLDLNKDPAEYSEADVRSVMDFANAAGSLVTTKLGAIPAMPTCEEIIACIKMVPKYQ